MEFIKTILKGGFLVLLPLLLFIMLLTEIVGLVVSLATPLANLFPAGTFSDPQAPVLLAIILLLVSSFFIGLAMKSKLAVNLGEWATKKTLGRLPIYHFVKNFVDGLLGVEEKGSFLPGLLDAGNGQREICYIVEDHGDGELTIMVPWAPTAFSGSIKIVPQSHVTLVKGKLGEASMVLSHLGLGACKLIKPNLPQSRADQLADQKGVE